MKKKKYDRLKILTVAHIIISVTAVFLITAVSALLYFTNSLQNGQEEKIKLASGKKTQELNAFFNSAESIANNFKNYILETIDEKRIITDSKYEEKYMKELSGQMASMTNFKKGTVCIFFRMNMEKYGPKKGVFLTGAWQKSFVNIRTTDLSRYSPTDTENVGWYYLPVWKKEPVWTPPYSNENIGQKMISYCIPLYRDGNLLGVTGIDLSLAALEETVNSIELEESKGLLLGEEQNLIHLNTQEELSRAVERSAELSVIKEVFQTESERSLKEFIWDGNTWQGLLSKLDNGMTYITAVSKKELLKPVQEFTLLLTAVFVLVCLLTAGLVLFIIREMTGPLKIITKTTNRLARGELYVDIPYTSKNEIGTIADNIRLMTTQLKEYITYISEQTKKEREAKEAALTESQINAAASRAKSAFLANMSHEIRTPINAVLGMNEMILREASEKEIQKYALNIKSAGSSLLSLVNDILDFSKIEAGKMELLPDNYETLSLIKDIVNMTKKRAETKGLEYIVKVSDNLPKTLYGDSIRLKQCILNLLTNSIKYTKEGSVTLLIDFSKTDENTVTLEVHVKDTGAGIKKEDMKKLFMPFERIEEEKNRTIEGSGLGLNIVRRLLDMMNSSLTAESTYGTGSDFYFSVEQKVIDWTKVFYSEETVSDELRKIKVYKEKLIAPEARLLFVDDTEMNLEVIKGLLKNTQMKIDTVLSGKEALDAVRNNEYDIIFIDHRMPEMDGIQTLHAMKEMKENRSRGKPCIALTANAITGVRKMYLEEGFDDYISKPVNPEKLEEMIFRWLPEKYLKKEAEGHSKEEGEQKKELNEKEALFIEKYRESGIFDTEKALKNCASFEILFSAVSQFYKSIEEKASEIDDFYNKEDWKNYGIKVHALKSTSRLIGAQELSVLAEKQEELCDRNEGEEIKENHKKLMDLFLSCKEVLKPFFDENMEEKTDKGEEITEEELLKKINEIIFCAETFDLDGLDGIVKELSSKKLPLAFSQKFDKICRCIDNVDFKELRNLLSEWSGDK